METLHLVVLAVVQGIAEFLPISSSAHLILVPKVLGWPDQGMIFDISLHLGTLCAVLYYFRADVARMFGGVFSLATGHYRAPNARLVLNLIVATIPAAAFGLMIKDIIEHQMRDILLIAFTSIVFGLLLWYADVLARRTPDTIKSVDDIGFGTALMWGIYQMFSLIPGVSRSGSCIIGGRSLGADRPTAGKFSVLMSIPITTLVVLSSLNNIDANLNWHNAGSTLLMGAGISFVFAFAGIDILMRWTSRVGYLPFTIYRVVLGFGLIGLYLFENTR